MTTLVVDKLWSFLQSLSLTANNKRWLAARLLESANAKSETNANEQTECSWENYVISQNISDLLLGSRKDMADDISDSLCSALEEKYK